MAPARTARCSRSWATRWPSAHSYAHGTCHSHRTPAYAHHATGMRVSARQTLRTGAPRTRSRPTRMRAHAGRAQRSAASGSARRRAGAATAMKRISNARIARLRIARGIRRRSALMGSVLLTHREAGPETAPVFEEVVDAPEGEHGVDHEQPLVHDAVIRADLPAGVFLDGAVPRMLLRCALGHDRGVREPGSSVDGLREEPGASSLSSSTWSTRYLIVSTSRNAPLTAPQTKALRAARPMSTATANAPRVRCSSIAGASSLPDSGVVDAWLLAIDPGHAGRLALGVEGQPRMVGADVRRVKRRLGLRGELELLARQRIGPGREREHEVRDGPALRVVHRVGE